MCALAFNPFAPELVPGTRHTYEIKALTEQAWGRFYVDVTKMTVEDVITAVQQHPGALEFIPEEYRIYEICLAAMKTATKEIIQYYLEQRDSPLRFVPMQYRTEKMCRAAAAWGTFAIKYFPKSFEKRVIHFIVPASAEVVVTRRPT